MDFSGSYGIINNIIHVIEVSRSLFEHARTKFTLEIKQKLRSRDFHSLSQNLPLKQAILRHFWKTTPRILAQTVGIDCMITYR